jgi:Yip1 domain
MSNLITRVQNILLAPKTEWPVIAAETETTAGLFTKYILIVSALGPIAMVLKGTLIGTSIPFVGTFRMGMGAALSIAVASYVLGLIAVFLFGLIINALAPTFSSQKDSVQSLKSAAYAMTAGWVGGIAQIIPWIGWLIGLALGVYGIYLLYLGLPHTMKTPADKAGGYTAVSVIAAIILSWVCWAIVGNIAARGMFGATGLPSITSSSGSFEKSSAGAALEDWAKNVESAGKAVKDSEKQNNGAPSAAAIGAMVGAVVAGGKGVDALPADQIKAYLPETLGGMPRTSTSASRNAAMGFQVAEASADYSDGAQRNLKLEIHDTGGAKGVLALANWANVEEEREWAGGYEKTYRADGRIVHERWDSGSNSGEYSLIVGDRFSVELSGKAASMDELKSTLATGVNLPGLETVAREAKPAS